MNIVERARHLAHKRLKALMSPKPEASPNYDRTLVIIDMQDQFLRDCSDLVPKVCELVEFAMQNEWPIVLVELFPQTETNCTTQAIIETLVGYPHQATIGKSEQNGGEEVIRCINDRKTWSLNLFVCGVYGDQCVPATVAGLFDKSDLVEVDVIADAIYPPYRSQSELDEHYQLRERIVTLEDIWNGECRGEPGIQSKVPVPQPKL